MTRCRQVRLVMHDEQVLLLNPQDILLARVAFEPGQVAVEAAQDLFWQHAVLPSMKTAPHWLSQWAPLWWKRIADIHLRDQEKHCAEVQES